MSIHEPFDSTSPNQPIDLHPIDSDDAAGSDGIQFVDRSDSPGSFDGPFAPKRLRRIGLPLISWIIITAIVLLIALRPVLVSDKVAQERKKEGGSFALKIMEVQGKYFVGATELPTVSGTQLYEGSQPLNDGTLDQRFRFIVLAGELAGASEATDKLKELDEKLDASGVKTTEEQKQMRRLLGELYSDYAKELWDAPSLDPSQRAYLQKNLGWFGSLALAPDSGSDKSARETVVRPARKTMYVVLAMALVALGLGSLGLCSFIIFLALVIVGKVRGSVIGGSFHGGVYAETFALWMVLFILLSILGDLFVPKGNLTLGMLLNLIAFFSSLCALLWPVLRGVSWNRVRRDIGLTLGKRPWSEPFWGAVCYVSTLPLLAIGVILMMALMSLAGMINGPPGDGNDFAPINSPSHPIVNWIGEAGLAECLMIVLLACVAAPIVEETMFRGVLYRHLRDATAAWRVVHSVMLSALFSSFVFAVIHPQGILGVPPLMALATGFALTREWRGSLIAPMTMHAMNNLGVTLLMFLIF